MRNEHKFRQDVICKCPKCGTEFDKMIVVEYVTNERGDEIEHRVV